jgi:hypothetical protein
MTNLTRYSLFSQKVQVNPITNQPIQRIIPGQTLLDHFIPGEQLYLAQNNEFTTLAEIENNAPPGTQLILVDRDDLIYGSPVAAVALRKVLPIDYLAGAYASIFKGDCTPLTTHRPWQVVVVDFSNNYDSGNANIPIEVSRQLVHDSCGAINAALLMDLATRQNAIQFRLGIKGANPTFAKGMLNPIDLPQLLPDGVTPDLILSLDSFKGHKPAPGLYEYQPDELFLGIKNNSLRTVSSISELLNIYPQAAPDVLPVIHAQAQILAANSQDLVTTAAHALNDYYLDGGDDHESQKDEFNTARLIEMALKSGRYNLLNSGQVQDWLADRINASWKNLSFGDIPQLNSNNATVLPAYDLKYGEVAIPWLADGEELIFYRSPIVNRNGVVTVKNNLRVWQDLEKLGADPNIMYVNVQTLDRIEQEDPIVYADLLMQYGSLEQLTMGFQTLMAATQMDFDGDTGNVIERSTVPHLYAAVKLNEHPAHKLANFQKSEKNLPTDWTLAQIAEHIRPNYVGVVYAHKRRLELSRAEIDVAIKQNDLAMMERFADEYFTKARALLFKDQATNVENQLTGRSLTAGFQPVHLSSTIRLAGQQFLHAFDETDITQRYGQTGRNFVKGKMIALQSKFQFLEIDQYDSYQFTGLDGATRVAFSPQLLQAITEFNQISLQVLHREPDRLAECIVQYQQLSKLISQEVDSSQPIELINSQMLFDRSTNTRVLTSYADTITLTPLAAPLTTVVDRLRLYQDLLDECIVTTSQLNQDAVDVFKSANTIHDEVSQALSTELARDPFNSISGKSKSLYKKNQKPQPTGIALPHLLQELCNQNHQVLSDNQEKISNLDLAKSFRDIPVSSAALAIAQFYISDDQQIIAELKGMGLLQSLNNNKKAYLNINLQGDSIKLLNLRTANFRSFKEAQDSSILLDFSVFEARITPFGEKDILATLDPQACASLAQKYPRNLTLTTEKFDALVEQSQIDLQLANTDRQEITEERRNNLDKIRQAFQQAGIEPLAALAAIAQVTNRSRAGYLMAAYPEALAEHIKSMPVDNLVLNTIAPEQARAVSQALTSTGSSPFNFQINDSGQLVIEAPGLPTVGFLNNHLSTTPTGSSRIDSCSSLAPNLVGAGSLVVESYCISLKLREPGKGLMVTHLTAAGQKLNNPQEQSAQSLSLSLATVQTLPYSINILGMDCPITHASLGLGEILAAEIENSAALEFREFRYNPLSPGTGKPSFSAIYTNEDQDYYLTGIIPEFDRSGKKVIDLQPQYFIKQNFSRQVTRCQPVITGYTLQQNIDGNNIKLGDITTKSAQAAGVLLELTHNSVRAAETLPEPILSSAIAKIQHRLHLVNPEKIYNSALWEISTPGKIYQADSSLNSTTQPLNSKINHDLQIDAFRAVALNDLSANPLLVTKTRQPVIVNAAVELQEVYQISCPAEQVDAVKAQLAGDQEKSKNIPYQLYSPADNQCPAYEPEYQRGYSVFIIDPQVVRKKCNNKADPLMVRIKELVEPGAKQPLTAETYGQQLQMTKIVRPIVAQNLQKLGKWLHDTGGLMHELPALDIDNLTRLPRSLAGVGEEARARFHARVGLTEDQQHTVFYFGSEYLRDRFISNLNNAPAAINGLSTKSRQSLIYAAVVPTADLNSYLKEHNSHYSYNCNGDGQTINPILNTYNINTLSSLPARAATDISMGFAANKYIGKSALSSRSRTDDYQDAYAEKANTSNYQAQDVVMVTGNRFDGKSLIRPTLTAFFNEAYLPLLQSASKAQATILFGNGNSIDALTKDYLRAAGYVALEHPHGYNEAVPTGRAENRRKVLAQILTSSIQDELFPTPGTMTVAHPQEMRIPVNLSQPEKKSQSKSLALQS